MNTVYLSGGSMEQQGSGHGLQSKISPSKSLPQGGGAKQLVVYL